jgi:hypothetical protein
MPAGTPVQVRLPDKERDALDEYRREFSNPPSRGQAARELLRQALTERDASPHSRRSALPDAGRRVPGGRNT